MTIYCLHANGAQPGDPPHCGQLKGNWFDADVLVSPLQADCENRFRFTADGRVQAAENADNGATETGSRLGLNSSKLRRLRWTDGLK